MSTTYAERLYVPVRWWILGTLFLATLWLAFIVALPGWIAWSATGAAVAITYALFWLIGSARVAVRDETLIAGQAHIPVRLLGDPEPLDRVNTRRVQGVDADARAYLLMRPYLKQSVRVPVRDRADPTPYWLVSTRHPERLSQRLREARGDSL